jgi:hypothetical protein
MRIIYHEIHQTHEIMVVAQFAVVCAVLSALSAETADATAQINPLPKLSNRNERKSFSLTASIGVSTQPEFVQNKIKMDGFLVVATQLEQIVDRGARDWPVLEQAFPLIRQDGDYQRKILDFTQP